MKKVWLTSAVALTLGGGALAQNSFPDVPADSYAADAVSQLVELGIVNGFPDGTYRGNDAFTRYQAALVVSRLLSVIEENTAAAGALSEEDLATVNNAVAELTNELTALSDRVAALESAPADSNTEALTALTDRVSSLETNATPGLADTFAALEGRVAALEQTPDTVPGPDVTALQEQVTALSEQVTSLETQLAGAAPTPTPEAPTAGEPTVPEEPAVDLAPVAAPDTVALSSEKGKFYVGLGSAYEINAADGLRFRPRVKIGVDDIAAGVGFRLSADYGRQSLTADTSSLGALLSSGSLATSGHLIYTLGSGFVSGYVGVGGGYQFANVFAPSGAVESPFAGALLGAEFGTGPITFFVEGGADYYFNSIETNPINAIDYDPNLYPTAAIGFNFRP